jgi:hypothetical protein
MLFSFHFSRFAGSKSLPFSLNCRSAGTGWTAIHAKASIMNIMARAGFFHHGRGTALRPRSMVDSGSRRLYPLNEIDH